eukprot:TRINITY_DN43954_c0_g1_i1.p2 TRINITY_DN43954_c0_g1~~TRINITY_DN43954_c0_g1_i1.p2  ORF type:complete len:319 (+),score=116.48 TRINITY_DN43954_c0_g1_i1:55-1011(+)
MAPPLAARVLCGAALLAVASIVLTGRLAAQTAPFGHASVHVATAADPTHYRGLAAAVSSAILAGSGDVHVHVFVMPGQVRRVEALLACAGGGSAVSVREFDAQNRMRNVPVRFSRDLLEEYGNLASPMNYVRFYLAELLPSLDKVVYVDADVVFIKSPKALYDTSLLTDKHVVAAVPRPHKPVGKYLNVDHQAVQKQRPDLEASTPSFNAGVVVLRLDLWRERECTGQVEWWMQENGGNGIFKLGSQPPMLLAFAGRTEALHPRWNLDGLGHRRGAEVDEELQRGASILHWSGGKKPWADGGLHAEHWWPHFPQHCFG